ncbi:MAG: hypothetical protein ACXAEF_11615 [Candidatus Thorarchaeota archaeon]
MNSVLREEASTTIATNEVEGVVIGKDFGSWAGFTSGRITIRTKDSTRIKFRYGQCSIGEEPDIGDLVEIEYTGTELFEISSISILKRQVETIDERVDLQLSGLTTIAGRPKSAFAMVVIAVFAGIGVILIGLSYGDSYPAAPSIYGAVGFSQFILAWLIWEYTGRG